MSKRAIPDSIIEFVRYRCKKGCKIKACTCRKEKLICTNSCFCYDNDHCENMAYETKNDSCDSDED